MATNIIFILIVVFSSVIGAIGGFFFKQASGKINSIISAIKSKELIIGFFFFGIAALLYLIALRNGELNVLYPISALSYVWSLFIGKKFLNEKINIYKQGGVALIIIGLIFIVNN